MDVVDRKIQIVIRFFRSQLSSQSTFLKSCVVKGLKWAQWRGKAIIFILFLDLWTKDCVSLNVVIDHTAALFKKHIWSSDIWSLQSTHFTFTSPFLFVMHYIVNMISLSLLLSPYFSILEFIPSSYSSHVSSRKPYRQHLFSLTSPHRHSYRPSIYPTIPSLLHSFHSMFKATLLAPIFSPSHPPFLSPSSLHHSLYRLI